MFSFESDHGWEQHVGRVGIEVVCRRLQSVLDHLRERYAGHQVDEIKQVLAREWEACTGGPITDPDLTRYASVISRGQRIVLEPEA